MEDAEEIDDFPRAKTETTSDPQKNASDDF
jgi:hypothetical protein